MTEINASEPLNPYAVSEKTAANLIGSSPSSLEKDRAVGHLGVPYVKAGRRILYRISDLLAWLEQNQVTPSVLNPTSIESPSTIKQPTAPSLGAQS
jgi:hypothetical protein